MSTAAGKTVFHPYKVISQERASLHLEPAIKPETMLLNLRLMPIVCLAIGIGLFLFLHDVYFLYIFAGIAVSIALLFTFLNAPSSISMDSVGFNLQTISIKGMEDRYYLWNDVDYIRFRAVRGKHNTSLVYHLILKSGKKVSFLTYSNYSAKKASIPEINAALQRVSNKAVVEK